MATLRADSVAYVYCALLATCENRVCGHAPQFGALRWRRNAAGETLLPAIATGKQSRRRSRRPRWPGGAARAERQRRDVCGRRVRPDGVIYHNPFPADHGVTGAAVSI